VRRAIRGNPKSSEAIRGHQRSSEAIRHAPRTRSHQRQSEVIRGHQRSSAMHLVLGAIRGNQRSSEVIRGNQPCTSYSEPSSEAIRGHQRSSEVIRHAPRNRNRWMRHRPLLRGWETAGATSSTPADRDTIEIRSRYDREMHREMHAAQRHRGASGGGGVRVIVMASHLLGV
jgi:hypothetical protein